MYLSDASTTLHWIPKTERLFVIRYLLSDREGQGHWAVLYKSHFPATKPFLSKRHHCIHRLINHIYTKGQARSYSLPYDMVAARIKHWDLRNISLGCVTRCQSIGLVERSLRDSLFTLRLPPFLHAEQVCLLAEAIASQSARYSRRIVTRDTSSIRLYASDYNNLCKGISHSVSNSSC